MSEASEKVLGIRHLPLFPLPLVLIPNELLPLHIFEPRYRQMFKDIGLERNLFGVSHFDSDDSETDRPEPGTIGCVAEVRETQTLEDGRSNLLAIGVIRYRLRGYVETGDPYFVGDVDFFEDDEEDETIVKPLADEVFALFTRIAKAAHKLSGEQGRLPQIPQAAPEPLSFLVTAAFNLDAEIKYKMLELTSTTERLRRLREILVQTVGKMEESADIHKLARTNGHSRKKIDL
ncbi:MAG: LON peptidase substrate-binding domain-containing protein [Acidobacteria bacterium]|nr:LON peptidase substrate-binding domain-containing protein [Acidobacteriota bacterium]